VAKGESQRVDGATLPLLSIPLLTKVHAQWQCGHNEKYFAAPKIYIALLGKRCTSISRLGGLNLPHL
jgi:hypothetical protein